MYNLFLFVYPFVVAFIYQRTILRKCRRMVGDNRRNMLNVCAKRDAIAYSRIVKMRDEIEQIKKEIS